MDLCICHQNIGHISHMSLVGAMIGMNAPRPWAHTHHNDSNSIKTNMTTTQPKKKMIATVSITKPALHNQRNTHHKNTNNPLRNFTTAPPFCPTMTTTPPTPTFPTPNNGCHAESSKVTQEETQAYTEDDYTMITIETVEETIQAIEAMDDYQKDFYEDTLKMLEQVVETFSTHTSFEKPQAVQAMEKYHKINEFVQRTTEQVRRSIIDLTKSSPHDLQLQTKALLDDLTKTKYSDSQYKSMLLKFEQKIQKRPQQNNTQGQRPSKKLRTATITNSKEGSIVLPSLANQSHRDLQKKVYEHFTKEYLPLQRTEEDHVKNASDLKRQKTVLIHYQEGIRSKVFAGFQNGETKTMQVSQWFRECFPCKYLSSPKAFGVVLPLKSLHTYHEIRNYWASISKEKKQQILKQRAALVKQFLVPTDCLCSPNTPLKKFLADKPQKDSGQLISILPHMSLSQDKVCYYAFMLCPTEHCPQHTYMSAFQYCTYLFLYLKDAIDERRRSPVCDARLDDKFYSDQNHGASVYSYVTGITVTLVNIFKFGPTFPIGKMNGKMHQINSSKDPYFQYFGIPLLMVAKRIFGKLLNLSDAWGTTNLEECGDTPKRFCERVLYALRNKGICSSAFMTATIDVHGRWDKMIPTHCFYPFLRVLQMVHKNWIKHDFSQPKCRAMYYFSITDEEKQQLQEKEPIRFSYPGLGEIELQPLISSVENPEDSVPHDYHPYKGPATEIQSFYKDD